MDTDPKKQNGDKKDPMQLLPTEPLRKMARVMGLGRDKYGAYNWRQSAGVETMTYVGAVRRHMDLFIDGEDVDEESGESHLAHIMASCAILLDAERAGKLIDDRPVIERVKLRQDKPIVDNMTAIRVFERCGEIFSGARTGPHGETQHRCTNASCVEMHDKFCTSKSANALGYCTEHKS